MAQPTIILEQAKVFTGNMTLDDFFVQMQAILAEELGEGLVPSIPPR